MQKWLVNILIAVKKIGGNRKKNRCYGVADLESQALRS